MPDGVGREFESAGHSVIYLRESIKIGSADDLVSVAAVANDAILVACDGDMKQMVKKYGVSGNRFSQLSLIKITVASKVQAEPRIRESMSLLEHEWVYSEGKIARRMYIEIKDSLIRTMR